MKHRKNEHTNFVAKCNKNENDLCRFGEKECWFIHSSPIVKDIENSEMLRRLFDMMEAFALRITHMKNQM